MERWVAGAVALELLLLLVALAAVALTRGRTLREARARELARGALTDAFVAADTASPADALASLQDVPPELARAELALFAEQLAAQERGPLRALYLALVPRPAEPAADGARLVREARLFADPLEVLPALLRAPDAGLRLGAFEAACATGQVALALTHLPDVAEENPLTRARVLDALAAAPAPPAAGLLALARHPRPAVRHAALAWLGARQVLEGVEALRAALADGDVEVRLQALRSLRQLGDPGSAQACLPALADAAWPVRMEAARTVAALARERGVPALAPLLEDPAEWVRHHTALALLSCGEPGARALEAAAGRGVVAAQSALARARLAREEAA